MWRKVTKNPVHFSRFHQKILEIGRGIGEKAIETFQHCLHRKSPLIRIIDFQWNFCMTFLCFSRSSRNLFEIIEFIVIILIKYYVMYCWFFCTAELVFFCVFLNISSGFFSWKFLLVMHFVAFCFFSRILCVWRIHFFSRNLHIA